MIRKFRAIVQTQKEPQDHEVLWYWKGKTQFYDNGEWMPFNFTYDNIYRVRRNPGEGYHTLATAVAAVQNRDIDPKDKWGFIITFEESKGKFADYRFEGTDLADFDNPSKWVRYDNSVLRADVDQLPTTIDWNKTRNGLVLKDKTGKVISEAPQVVSEAYLNQVQRQLGTLETKVSNNTNSINECQRAVDNINHFTVDWDTNNSHNLIFKRKDTSEIATVTDVARHSNVNQIDNKVKQLDSKVTQLTNVVEQAKRQLFDDLWTRCYDCYIYSAGTEYICNDVRLSYEEALSVYNAPRLTWNDGADFTLSDPLDQLNPKTIILSSAANFGRHVDLSHKFYRTPFIIIRLAATENSLIRFTSSKRAFAESTQLTAILGTLLPITKEPLLTTFAECGSLEYVMIKRLQTDISLAYSPNINYHTIQCLVNNATNTEPITVTLHPDVYKKLNGTATNIDSSEQREWQAILEAACQKNILFASGIFY